MLVLPMFCRIGVSLPHLANGPNGFETCTKKFTDFVLSDVRASLYWRLAPFPL